MVSKIIFEDYTTFSEDLLYTSLLYKLKKIIIPHPFLNITKCSYKQQIKNDIKSEKIYELIYIFLPCDDVGNNKIFDLMNYISNVKHDVSPKNQDDEIKELKEKLKLSQNNNLTQNNNFIQNDNFYDDLNNDTTKLINKNISCSIHNKTNTKLYMNKYSNSKNVFEIFNTNFNIASRYFNKINNNLLLNYDNLLVVFNTNIDNKQIFCTT